MTSQELITNLSHTSLVGIKISDLSVSQNNDTLLVLLNMAKNKIAEDTLLWINGEQITMIDGTQEYTLGEIPIQIVDVYDDKLNVRPRNKPDYLGYYQTNPQTLKFNSIQNGTVVNINYYETPTDYLIDDTLVIPPSLLSAMQFYIAHKAFEIYKSEKDILMSVEYFKKYKGAIEDFKKNSDSSGLDTVHSLDNKIWLRGIR